MRPVSQFEFDLLEILHGILGRRPPAELHELLRNRRTMPVELSRNGVELIQDTLAKGTVELLATSGAWRSERFIRGDRVVSGPAWQRSDPATMGLYFSPTSLEFLMWLVAHETHRPHQAWRPPYASGISLGDEWLMFLAMGAAKRTDINKRWFEYATLTDLPLIALKFPDCYTSANVPDGLCYRRWVNEPGCIILESLQCELADAWTEIEYSKRNVVRPVHMRSIGLCQRAVLSAFREALEFHNRRDLSRFLLVALANVTGPKATAKHWRQRLQTDGLRLAERTELYGHATILLQFARQLQKWNEEFEAVSYVDDAYTWSQLWKSDWERFDGERSTTRALELAKELGIDRSNRAW